ncbi:MAG: DUF2752 domain-containing protein [Flavobacteriales bacterium]|nr:DUF2752 domain-containing protein [Flavobacteriales bacterium]HRN42122.1 DUF2752 domain-containing protein [Vicingus sp.]HRP59684.1 DUF2752 domain-containing protein [Vicingus sp.]
MFEKLIFWLESHLFLCPYKTYFNIDCMGCGMQRSFIALLKGNLSESFYLYPALIPLLLMLVFLPLHLVFKFKHGANLLKYFFILNIGIVVVSYFIKLVA